ncbi:MAG: hypothetical protein JXR07_20295 [Reichenbachiella sp.]
MKKLLAIAMAFLGVTKLSEENGKQVLTEDQQNKIKAAFGEEMLQKISAHLSEGASDSAEEEVSEDDEAEINASAEMITALANQNATVSASFQAKFDALTKQNGSLQAAVAALADTAEEDPIPELDASIPRNADAPVVMKIDSRKPHYNATANFLKTGVQMANEAGDTIDVADLRTEFGTFLNSQRNLEIFRMILTGFTTAKYMTTKMATTEYRAVQSLITSVVQQFTPKWTPSGKAKFKPLVIKNYRHKINVPIVPSDVLDSYMMHLYDEGLAPDQMPITNYITNVLVLPQLLQDIELRMIGKGKYVEKDWSTVDTGDAGTPPEDSMNGFETILVTEKADANTNVNFFDQTIDWINATDQEVLDFVNAFVDWINPQYQSQKQPVFCSLDVYKRYKRAYKKVWGTNSGQDGDFGNDQIDYSNNILVVLDSMYKSPIIFATPKANFIKLRHKNDVPNVINDIQKADYMVKLFGEFWLSAGFAIAEAVFAYVPVGYDPKLSITEVWGAHTEYQQHGIGSGSASGGL